MKTETRAYGSWKSPITPSSLAAGSLNLSQLRVANGRAYWAEMRPAEEGRVAIVSCPLRGGPVREEIPAVMSARNRVNEYGSGAYCVSDDGLWFTNLKDQRLYRIGVDGACVPITPAATEDQRYCDPQLSPDGRWIVCQRERHPAVASTRAGEVLNELVLVPADGSDAPRVIASGCDFYGPARLRPDGRALAWLQWNHPQMPWDGCELMVASLGADGTVRDPRRVAGGKTVSVFQPSWSAEGVLHFVSDQSGWWNLYRLEDQVARNLCPMEAEFGSPYWAFWISMHTHLESGRIASLCIEKGQERLGLVDADRGCFEAFALPLSNFGQGGELVSDGADRLVFLGGSPTRATAIYSLSLQDHAAREGLGTNHALRELHRPGAEEIDPRYLSEPRVISFPAAPFSNRWSGRTPGEVETRGDGDAVSHTAHAFYYPPKNDDYVAPEGERPPLVVMCHGGPTGATNTALMLKAQFWTSRGFAVVDVNYRGSTGYGRAYREAINGNSGLVEPRDCEAAARYLAKEGLVDEARMAVRGGSAGGYVVLCCAVFPSGDDSCFSAGTSLYGIGDLEALVRDTHKFESHYPFTLIAPYPAEREVYRERSPLYFVQRAAFPLFLMQGLQDPVVPPNQAEGMAKALREAHLPFAYLPFEGEGHGFRREENIAKSFAAELSFYGQVFGFRPDSVDFALKIENLG